MRKIPLHDLTRRAWEARLRGYSQVEIADALRVSQSTVSRALRRAERAATANAEPTLARWRAEALARYEFLSKQASREFEAKPTGERSARWLALLVSLAERIHRLQGLEDVALPVRPDLPDQYGYPRRIMLTTLSDDALEALYAALGGPPEPDHGSPRPIPLPSASETPAGRKRPTTIPTLGGPRDAPEMPSRKTETADP